MSLNIAVSQLNNILSAFYPLKCWRLGRYLGSMLTLDFGDRPAIRTTDSLSACEGELMIGIRNVFWVAIDNGQTIANANDIDDAQFKSQLERRPLGAALKSIESTADDQWIILGFDNEFAQMVDAKNSWNTISDIFEITLPNGQMIVLDSGGRLEVLDEVERSRAEGWDRRVN